uniref:DUF7583 domain-containing protein n=1 Tax=Strongyloides stercoralis TaxID=6248 RepID=A0AAF5CUN8_STRER
MARYNEYLFRISDIDYNIIRNSGKSIQLHGINLKSDTIYLENETAVQPNCSVQRTIFGYLDSVTVDGVATKLNDLPTDGASMNNLKLVEAFTLVVADITEDRVTLDCFYVTINGNVTLGEEIYAVKLNDDIRKEQEKNKELETKNKSLLSELKSKIGPIGAYAVIIITALVALTIILVVGILLYKKFLKEWVVKKGLFKKNKDEPKVAGKKKQ